MHFKQFIRGLNYPEKLHIYLSKDLIDKLIFISCFFFCYFRNQCYLADSDMLGILPLSGNVLRLLMQIFLHLM